MTEIYHTLNVPITFNFSYTSKILFSLFFTIDIRYFIQIFNSSIRLLHPLCKPNYVSDVQLVLEDIAFQRFIEI